jgi:hypothetical protein
VLTIILHIIIYVYETNRRHCSIEIVRYESKPKARAAEFTEMTSNARTPIIILLLNNIIHIRLEKSQRPRKPKLIRRHIILLLFFTRALY